MADVEKKTIEDFTEEELKALSPEERAQLLETGELPFGDEEPEPSSEEPEGTEEEPEGDEEGGEEEPEGDDEPTDEELDELVKSAEEPKDDPIWKSERKKRQKEQEENERLRQEMSELQAKMDVFEKLIESSGKEEEPEDEDEIQFDDDMSLEEYTDLVEKRLLKRVEKLISGKEEEKGEKLAFRTLTEKEMQPPRFVDPDGNDYSGYIESGEIDFRRGRRWELVKDEKTGDTKPVFDAYAVYEVDVDTVDRFGERVFNAMWGTEDRPGPLAQWRADDFRGFLLALNEPDPAQALFDKYLEIRGKKGAPMNAGKPEEEPRGFGAEDRGSSGARPSAKKYRTIRDYSDSELMQMTDDERNELLNG